MVYGNVIVMAQSYSNGTALYHFHDRPSIALLKMTIFPTPHVSIAIVGGDNIRITPKSLA